MILAWFNATGTKVQFGRSYRKAAAFGSGNNARSLHRSQMLPHQTGLGALTADVADLERLAGDKRQRARIAHDLATAFAFRTVDFNHNCFNQCPWRYA
jgi:hypothetical protein